MSQEKSDERGFAAMQGQGLGAPGKSAVESRRRAASRSARTASTWARSAARAAKPQARSAGKRTA